MESSAPRSTGLRPLSHLHVACLALLMTLICTACNLSDPDVGRAPDATTSDTSGDTVSPTDTDETLDSAQTDTSAQDSSDDTGQQEDTLASEDTSNDEETCTEPTENEFCLARGTECGVVNGTSRCGESIEANCGVCSGESICIDNVCECRGPWTGDGVASSFILNSQFYVMNLEFIWSTSTETGDWSRPKRIKNTASPVDFVSAPMVSGRHLWDDDGPTAAVQVDEIVLFFNDSLFWAYVVGSGDWLASGDLAGQQEIFDLEDSGVPFGDGVIEAAYSESRESFYLFSGNEYQQFKIQRTAPLQIESIDLSPKAVADLYSSNLFSTDSSMRPWDTGMTFAASGNLNDQSGDTLVLGSEDDVWLGPDEGPLRRSDVSSNSMVFAGVECVE